MKKLNKCWKLIGGGVAASSVLATSVVAPLTSNKYQNQKQNNTNLIPPPSAESTNTVTTSVSDPITSVDASVLFNDASVTGTITVTTTATTVNNVYDLTVVAAPDGGITATGKDLTMVDSFLDSNNNLYKVTSIGENAFNGNMNRTLTCNSLTLPYTLTSIGDAAFFGGFFNSLNIDRTNLTQIGSYAFRYTDIGSLELPNTLSIIGPYAFTNCTELSTVTYNKNLTSIGESAFEDCTKIKNLDLSVCDNLNIAATDICIWYMCTGLESIKLPDQISSIPAQSFYGCSALTNFNFTGISSIGDQAFQNCSSLSSITLPKTLTSIGTNAFQNCTLLTTIDLTNFDPNNIPSWGNNIFSYMSSTTKWLLPYTNDSNERNEWYDSISAWTGTTPTNIVMSDDASQWISGTTSGSLDLTVDGTYLTLSKATNFKATNPFFCPYSYSTYMRTINDNVFNSNSNIYGQLSLSPTIRNIGAGAFANLTNVTKVNLSAFDSAALASGFAINSFENTNAIYQIPYSTDTSDLLSWYTSVGDWTNNTNPTLCMSGVASDWMNNASGDLEVKIQDSTCSSFTISDGTAISGTDCDITNQAITVIDENAFKGDINLINKFNIPNSITTIGANAFSGCSGLNEIDLNWDPSVFDKSNALSIDPNWLNELNKESMTIKVPVGTVDAYKAKASEWGMDKCILTDGTTPTPTPTYTDASQFFTSDNSTPVTGNVCYTDNGSDITILETNAESNETIQTNVVGTDLVLNSQAQGSIGKPISNIGDNAFIHSQLSGSLDISQAFLTTIGNNAFSNNTNLTSVIFAKSLTTVGEYAFKGCNLSSVTFNQVSPDWMTGLDPTWLGDTTSIKNTDLTIYVPEGSVDAYTTYIADNPSQCAWFNASTMTIQAEVTPTPSGDDTSLGLTLGLSIGLGVSLIGVVVGWIAYAVKANKAKKID